MGGIEAAATRGLGKSRRENCFREKETSRRAIRRARAMGRISLFFE